MNLLFWRKSEVVHEKCIHKDAKCKILGTLKFVQLEDGHHTSFMVLKCCKCGGMKAFPSENLNLALREGTSETKEQLRVLSEKVRALEA